MAQDPLGHDQSAWYPQQEWQSGYGEDAPGTPGGYETHPYHRHHQPQGQYEDPYQGQAPYPYPYQGQQQGQYQDQAHGVYEAYGTGAYGYYAGPYGESHPGAAPAQPYAPYPVPQQPTGEQLYVPADVTYSADGYVSAEALAAAQSARTTAGTAAPADAVAGTVAGTSADADADAAADPDGDTDDAGTAGSATRRGGPARSSLADRARAAADAVVAADRAPSRRALAVRTAAGVAALGVLVAAGLMVSGQGGTGAAGGDDPAGFAVAHARAWAAQPPEGLPAGTDGALVGGWLVENLAVRADSTGVRGYDLAAGKQAWAVEPPAAGAVPCGLSPTTGPDGLGAVLFRPQADPKSPCSLVTAVDARTGRTLWTKPLSETKGTYTARVSVTEDKVIAIGDDHVVAWSAADGKDIWQYTGQGKFCTLSGGVSGKTVMVASSCADSTPGDQAVALNTADGKVSWWRGLNNQPRTVTVLSAEPAVVLTTGEKPADDRVFAWGAAGDPAVEIPVAVDGGRLDVAHGTFAAVPGVFFRDRTMVTTVAPAGGSGPVSVVGYDLDSGRQRWKSATAEKSNVRAVGLDDTALLVAADERVEQPAHLSRFALADGRESVGGAFPQGTGSLLLAGRVLVGGGKVVALPEHSANFGTATAYQAAG